jgi:hypothetical protein
MTASKMPVTAAAAEAAGFAEENMGILGDLCELGG